MFERCLYFNANAMVRRINKIWEQAYDSVDLSPAHAYLLRLLLDAGELSQQQIAEELQLEKSTIARFVSSLESRGLVKRMRSGREQIVKPTSLAIKMKKKLNTIGDELYKQMQQQFGEDELTGIVNQLKTINQKL